TSTESVAGGGDFPGLTINVSVDLAAPAALDNVATVANAGVEGGAAVSGNTDAATILHPDLSTSTMTVLDVNGGDVDPGDVLRYTVTLVETGGGAVSGASVTDVIPAGVGGFTVVSFPAGSTDASLPVGGANGAGLLDVQGIDVAADDSETVVFEVTVGGGAAAGDTIANSATIVNPNGDGATAVAPTVTVMESEATASGNKL